MINFFKRLFNKEPNKYADKYKCTLKKDKVDCRDFVFTASNEYEEIPDEVSFLDGMPEIWNQGSIGSCQSFALARIISYFYKNSFDPSMLYMYYNVRQYEADDPLEDSGGTLRGTLKSTNNMGVCESKYHPYLVENINLKPSNKAYSDGIGRIAGDKLLYYRATSINDIKRGMSKGYVPYVGVMITDSFYSDKCMTTGVIPMPKGKQYGGHALVLSRFVKTVDIFGNKKSVFTIENSWGSCGCDGRFTVTDKVLEKILIDCWLVKIVPDEVNYCG